MAVTLSYLCRSKIGFLENYFLFLANKFNIFMNVHVFVIYFVYLRNEILGVILEIIVYLLFYLNSLLLQAKFANLDQVYRRTEMELMDAKMLVAGVDSDLDDDSEGELHYHNRSGLIIV